MHPNDRKFIVPGVVGLVMATGKMLVAVHEDIVPAAKGDQPDVERPCTSARDVRGATARREVDGSPAARTVSLAQRLLQLPAHHALVERSLSGPHPSLAQPAKQAQEISSRGRGTMLREPAEGAGRRASREIQLCVL